MHAAGIHSALAVKRQRKKQHQKKVKERRASAQSGIDSLHASTPSISRDSYAAGGGKHRKKEAEAITTKAMGAAGMFHLGVVFVILGFFMIISSLVTAEYTGAQWDELLGTGLVCVLFGGILVMVNRVATQREEDELTRFLQTKLARTRSGQRLVRDAESGLLTPNERQPRVRSPKERSPSFYSAVPDENVKNEKTTFQHETSASIVVNNHNPLPNGEPPLEQIEEEIIELIESNNKSSKSSCYSHEESTAPVDNGAGGCGDSGSLTISPSSPTETQILISNGKS